MKRPGDFEAQNGEAVTASDFGEAGYNSAAPLGERAEQEAEIQPLVLENQIPRLNLTVPSPNDTFSEEEAAGYLKVPADSVRYYAVRAGDLAYCDLGKGRRTYLRKDLDAFLARRREPSIHEKVKTRPRGEGAET